MRIELFLALRKGVAVCPGVKPSAWQVAGSGVLLPVLPALAAGLWAFMQSPVVIGERQNLAGAL